MPIPKTILYEIMNKNVDIMDLNQRDIRHLHIRQVDISHQAQSYQLCISQHKSLQEYKPLALGGLTSG